jgi:hypothetical protein
MDQITIAEISQLAIVGAVVSVAVQYLKATFGTSPASLRLAVVGLSLVLGTGYWFLKDTTLLTSFLGILLFANTVYAFVTKPLEDAGNISGR